MTQPFIETDDPNDPCAYCVQWDEPEFMDSGNFEQARPVNPDGSTVERIYRFTHDACEQAVMAYIADSHDGKLR